MAAVSVKPATTRRRSKRLRTGKLLGEMHGHITRLTLEVRPPFDFRATATFHGWIAFAPIARYGKAGCACARILNDGK